MPCTEPRTANPSSSKSKTFVSDIRKAVCFQNSRDIGLRVVRWKYIGSAESPRVASLTRSLSFSEIVERVRQQMSIVCCHRQDCDDRPGFSRVIYCADIGYSLFDLFFNSEFGYRGAYFQSPESGLAANRQLFHALTEKLLAWIAENGSGQNPTLIRASLSAISVKVWLAESTLELCAACSGEWSASHKSDLEIANGRWELDNHTHAEWGRQAPWFRKLRIFGGFVNDAVTNTLRRIKYNARMTSGNVDGHDR
jgi:hypothetical protein